LQTGEKRVESLGNRGRIEYFLLFPQRAEQEVQDASAREAEPGAPCRLVELVRFRYELHRVGKARTTFVTVVQVENLAELREGLIVAKLQYEEFRFLPAACVHQQRGCVEIQVAEDVGSISAVIWNGVQGHTGERKSLSDRVAGDVATAGKENMRRCRQVRTRRSP